MKPEAVFGTRWDIGDVIFSEDTEVKTADGITETVVVGPHCLEPFFAH
jgi:hypothetical protein